MNGLAAVGGLITLVIITSVALTRGMMAIAVNKGWVYRPKANRWSQTQTALFGGVAIVVAFAVGAVATFVSYGSAHSYDLLGLFVGGAIVFAVGLRDDAQALDPQVKLVGQILAIMPFLVGAGLEFTSTTFVLSIPLVLFWMLALTNAFNLLDNMDGLSAGTAAIVGVAIGTYALLNQRALPGILALLVAASCVGFLVYNFRPRGPAMIFMGDCGSMFLGFILSGLAVIAFCPVAPQPLDLQIAQCLLPLLIVAVPIFDTTLVVIIRKQEGRAISQGGRDHSSHRLVYSGRTDKQAVLLLYLPSAIGGLIAIVLGQYHSSTMVFGAIALELILLFWLGTYLNRFPGETRNAVKAHAIGGVAGNGDQERVDKESHQDRH